MPTMNVNFKIPCKLSKWENMGENFLPFEFMLATLIFHNVAHTGELGFLKLLNNKY